MNRLLDSGGTALSQRMISWLPRMDPLVVVNRTLDGQYHRQTIGSAARLLDLQLIVSDSGRYAIETAWATGANLRTELDGWYRTGPVHSEPDWQTIRRGPLTEREYLVKLTLAINTEGAI